MAVSMTRHRLLLQEFTGHISEVSNQNTWSGVVSLCNHRVCQTLKKSEGMRNFFVDLVWNDPIREQ